MQWWYLFPSPVTLIVSISFYFFGSLSRTFLESCILVIFTFTTGSDFHTGDSSTTIDLVWQQKRERRALGISQIDTSHLLDQTGFLAGLFRIHFWWSEVLVVQCTKLHKLCKMWEYWGISTKFTKSNNPRKVELSTHEWNTESGQHSVDQTPST